MRYPSLSSLRQRGPSSIHKISCFAATSIQTHQPDGSSRRHAFRPWLPFPFYASGGPKRRFLSGGAARGGPSPRDGLGGLWDSSQLGAGSEFPLAAERVLRYKPSAWQPNQEIPREEPG